MTLVHLLDETIPHCHWCGRNLPQGHAEAQLYCKSAHAHKQWSWRRERRDKPVLACPSIGKRAFGCRGTATRWAIRNRQWFYECRCGAFHLTSKRNTGIDKHLDEVARSFSVEPGPWARLGDAAAALASSEESRFELITVLPRSERPAISRRSIANEFADHLRENSPLWGRYPHQIAPSTASKIPALVRRGLYATFRDGFEAACVDGVLYVRFVGGAA